MNASAKQSVFHLVIIVIFFCAVSAPLVHRLLHSTAAISDLEKRTLAALPAAPQSLKELKSYPKSLETYYQDHFGFRETLTYLYKRMQYAIGDSPSENVLIGRDGWLFLDGDRFLDPVGDYRNLNTYSQQEITQLAAYLIGKQRWLAKQHIKYIFVIAPNKHTIYSEKLPSRIKKAGPCSAVDQLVAAVGHHPDFHMVDLREPLLSAKTDDRLLYYKTDTHWNDLGANVAQFELAKKLADLFPGRIRPRSYEDRLFDRRYRKGGDLAYFIGLPNIFDEIEYRPLWDDPCTPRLTAIEQESRKPLITECPDARITALIFRDSFFSAVQPFLGTYFQQATYIWQYAHFDTLAEYIQKRKPDVVIEEWAERVHPYKGPFDDRFVALGRPVVQGTGG